MFLGFDLPKKKQKQNLKELWHEVKTVGTATRLRTTLNISKKGLHIRANTKQVDRIDKLEED